MSCSVISTKKYIVSWLQPCWLVTVEKLLDIADMHVPIPMKQAKKKPEYQVLIFLVILVASSSSNSLSSRSNCHFPITDTRDKRIQQCQLTTLAKRSFLTFCTNELQGISFCVVQKCCLCVCMCA